MINLNKMLFLQFNWEIIFCVTTQPNRVSHLFTYYSILLRVDCKYAIKSIKKLKKKGFEVLTEMVIKNFIFRDVEQRSACFHLLHDGVLLGLFINREYGSDMVLRNIG
jgi:hypothetical protein